MIRNGLNYLKDNVFECFFKKYNRLFFKKYFFSQHIMMEILKSEEDGIEIMMNDKADEIIEELFYSTEIDIKII